MYLQFSIIDDINRNLALGEAASMTYAIANALQSTYDRCNDIKE